MLSQPSLPISELSRAQRHSYLILRLLLAEHPLMLSDCDFSDTQAKAFHHQEATPLAATLSRVCQLTLNSLPGGRYSLSGTELHRRMGFFSHLRRLLRQVPQCITEDLAPRITRRLLQQYPQLQSLCTVRLGQLLPVVLCSDHESLLRDQRRRLLALLVLFSLGSSTEVSFTIRQQQWLSDKPGLTEAHQISEYCLRQGAPPGKVTQDETLFLVLLFAMMTTPFAGALITRQQQRIMASARQLIRCFSHASDVTFREDPTLEARLYCHLSLALERNYFSVGLEDQHLCELIAQYPAMFRQTSKALRPVEQTFAVSFSAPETLLIALILVAAAMQACGYEERQLVILTDDQPQQEKEIERCLREALLLPVTFHYQSLSSFYKDGAPRGVALVVSPYSVRLPLYSPPVIHTPLPISEHQYESIRQILR